MAAVGTVRLIWSGGEDDFCAAKIGTQLAIEERCKSGIGAVYQRVCDGTWKIFDISEVIRLALIGAGMEAAAAKEKVDVHVLENPNGLAPSILLSMRILEAVIVGVQDDPVGKKEAAGEEPTPTSITPMDASAAQPSMVSGGLSNGAPA